MGWGSPPHFFSILPSFFFPSPLESHASVILHLFWHGVSSCTCMLNWVFLTNSVTCCRIIRVCVSHVLKVHCTFVLGHFILPFRFWRIADCMKASCNNELVCSQVVPIFLHSLFFHLSMSSDLVYKLCPPPQDFKSPHMISKSTDVVNTG